MICRMYYDIFFMSDCKFVWVSPMDLSQINHCNAFLSTFMCWIPSSAFMEPVTLLLPHKGCTGIHRVLVGLYWWFLNQPNWAYPGLSKIPSLHGQCGGIVTSFSWFLCTFLLFPHTRLPGGFILPTPAEQTWQPPGDIMKVFFLPSGMYQCYEW